MHYITKYRLYLALLILFFLPFENSNGEELVDFSYREKIVLQGGRNMYVAGETVWYKAFAFSNLQNIYSKVLYIELVDSENRHILGQIVEISNGMAASSFYIPDTLTTGTYSLKAYTNWMRNFNPVNFATYPVYIFNQYDDIEEENMKDYSLHIS